MTSKTNIFIEGGDYDRDFDVIHDIISDTGAYVFIDRYDHKAGGLELDVTHDMREYVLEGFLDDLEDAIGAVSVFDY